ncbi:MAG: heavy-metal-associated domain-containing protein [Candidatus Zixiibacteriota bacterium]|nr:MAG: heavy-metal-associated domain-containing protein [candidate division Zixibacteria bacterium]
MKKLTVLGFAIVFGFALIGAPVNTMACGAGGTSSADAAVGASKNYVQEVESSASSDPENYSKKAVETAVSKKADETETKFVSASFNVKGMTCTGCEGHLTKVLQSHDAITSVDKVCHVSGTAMVHYDPSKLDSPMKIAKVITNAGYAAELVPAVATSEKTEGTVAKTSTSKTGKPAACSAERKTVETDDGSR